MNFEGAYPALVTPFKEGELDLGAYKRLIAWQVEAGSAGLVACGSTGEAATLSEDEYAAVVDAAVKEARGRVPVVAGIGTNATAKTLEQAKKAERLGVDALLVLVPYYNKPTQEGLFQHFSAVAKASRLPQIVYNIPGRTGVNLQAATLARIARAHSNIVAVKEASGSLDQVSETRSLAPKLAVLSGDDSLTLPMLSVGAKGVISVVSNIAPAETAELCASFLKGDAARAQELHLKLFPLIKALFIETNPIPVKTALGLMGLCSNELRLPLCPMEGKNAAALKEAMSEFGLLRKVKDAGRPAR